VLAHSCGNAGDLLAQKKRLKHQLTAIQVIAGKIHHFRQYFK
jgi:hypothetical protein